MLGTSFTKKWQAIVLLNFCRVTLKTYPKPVFIFPSMSDLLLDINLQQVPDSYLAGAWRVAHRVVNQADPGSALAQATNLLLTDKQLHLQAPTLSETGSWDVQRDELLNRPYLRLYFPTEELRALVTRLRRTTDGGRSQLNLYFSTGLEMQLDRP
jgi:hypothetical protein